MIWFKQSLLKDIFDRCFLTPKWKSSKGFHPSFLYLVPHSVCGRVSLSAGLFYLKWDKTFKKGILTRNSRYWFTAAELARAFDVPKDRIERVAGNKIAFNRICIVREAVLDRGSYSVYVGNNFTLNEARRLLEDDKTALLGVKVKIANDTGDYIVQIKDLLKSSHFMVAKDKLTD